MSETSAAIHPAATDHVPFFVPGPDGSDPLMGVMAVFMVVVVLLVGVLYLKLHALPEHMAHRTNKVQFQVVAVLALLALFTHNHAFWIAALLLAMVDLPDVLSPLRSIARSLERLSGREAEPAPLAAAGPHGPVPVMAEPLRPAAGGPAEAPGS